MVSESSYRARSQTTDRRRRERLRDRSGQALGDPFEIGVVSDPRPEHLDRPLGVKS
jgi:hypothetical protein